MITLALMLFGAAAPPPIDASHISLCQRYLLLPMAHERHCADILPRRAR